MKKVLNVLKLNLIFIFLTINGCALNNESPKEKMIKSVIHDIAINNNCKIEFELNNSTMLNLSVTQNEKQQKYFLNGFIVLEVFKKLKNKGFSNLTIQIAPEGKPKEYLRMDQKGYEKIIKMKSRSKSCVELVKKNKKKFYDLFH
jgi:predicted metal-dependent phosphotriesterase family hydrolase